MQASAVATAGTTAHTMAKIRHDASADQLGGGWSPITSSAMLAVNTEPTIQKEATRVMATPRWWAGTISVAREKIGGVAAPTPVPATSRAAASTPSVGEKAAAKAAPVASTKEARRRIALPESHVHMTSKHMHDARCTT